MKETEVVDRLARIETHLEHYNELLKEHMRRTEISERRLDELYRYKWLAVGAIAVITFAIQLAGKALLK